MFCVRTEMKLLLLWTLRPYAFCNSHQLQQQPSQCPAGVSVFVLGNGLRGHVWSELETRFQIKTIVEYFGQTEYPTGRAPRASTLSFPL